MATMAARVKRLISSDQATPPRSDGPPQQTRQDDTKSDTEAPTYRVTRNLTDLPTELHLLISRELIYPDALSLKHVNRHFYNSVDVGVELQVEWFMERRALHLDCPNDRRCDLSSDLKFCRGSVKLLMQRRREHFECESRPGLGCLVYGTPKCKHQRDWRVLWRRWMHKEVRFESWWLLVAAMAVWIMLLIRDSQRSWQSVFPMADRMGLPGL